MLATVLAVLFTAVFIPIFLVIRKGRINAINNNKERALAREQFAKMNRG